MNDIDRNEGLVDLRESTYLLGDAEALDARYQEDGYLLLRDQLPRAAVESVREALTQELERQGCQRVGPAPDALDMMDRSRIDEVQVHEHMDYDALWHDTATLELFRKIMEEDVHVFKQTVVRYLPPGEHQHLTPAHQCSWFVQPNDDFRVVWTSLSDLDRTMGGLAVAPGSHRLGPIEHVPYEAQRSYSLGGGTIWGIPEEAQPTQWAAASTFSPGDVLIFHAHLMHKSLANLSTKSRLRLSMDTRIQPAQSERGFLATHTMEEVKKNPDKVLKRSSGDRA